jgi:hypothetical protein
MKLLEWIKHCDIVLQVAILSSLTTLIVFLLGCIFKYLYEKSSMSYKMKKEYLFEQRKKIKENLCKTKTPLIKSAEELNYRLWNLSKYIDEKWHNIKEDEWKNEEKYYLRSFTYRFLCFIYWILKAEESIYSFDLCLADSNDKLYLKFIKTLKHFFCERELLEELGYNANMKSNHFYRDNLVIYASYLSLENTCIDFKGFEEKFKVDYSEIRKVVKYINEIESNPTNLNYNVIKAFHIFLMIFLNKYGLDYHHSSTEKIKKLIHEKYSDLQIKKGIYNFLERNKILKESKVLIKGFNMVK